MAKFSANIEMLAPSVDFLSRIPIAKASGFDAIEFWSWENKDLFAIRDLAVQQGLGVSSISGDGPDYSLCDDAHAKAYIDYARASFEAAKQVGCSLVVLHSNALRDGAVVDSYDAVPRCRLFMNMAKTLSQLAPYAEKQNIICALESLNVQVDHRGNLLRTLDDACEVVKVVQSRSIKLLFDLYHMQIETGNLIATYDRCRTEVAHIHVADNPGRHEPGTGEINFKTIFSHLEEQRYAGYIAFELSPSSTYEKAVEAIMAVKP